jgi:hypothetical protein
VKAREQAEDGRFCGVTVAAEDAKHDVVSPLSASGPRYPAACATEPPPFVLGLVRAVLLQVGSVPGRNGGLGNREGGAKQGPASQETWHRGASTRAHRAGSTDQDLPSIERHTIACGAGGHRPLRG